MWSSWFGGFAQPSDYATADPPKVNIQAIIVSSIFVIPYLAFLIILPGVRRKALITFAVITIVMFVGASLGAALYYPEWTGGNARIISQFRAHANERILARLGVHVGLTHINVTLKHDSLLLLDPYSSPVDWAKLEYNERFDISGVSSMVEALHEAYDHGLPYPMLSVLEYFSLNQDAFDWGRHYRVAGHYTYAFMVFSMFLWSLSVAYLLFVPHLFCTAFLFTGLSALFSCLLYLIMSPCQLRIGFVGVNGNRINMDMNLQWAFYLVFAVGLLATIFGLTLFVLQHFRIYTLSTFVEATLDEKVGPKMRCRNYTSAEDIASSSDVIRRCKLANPTKEAADKCCEKRCNGSSGFQSRASNFGSLRSQSSFESVHDEAELERSPSNLTLEDTRQRRKEEHTVEIGTS